MILISPTRTLLSPRPIDTDPVLNYRHIQPAAAAAAVGPWLCSQHQHHDDSPPSSPTTTTSNNASNYNNNTFLDAAYHPQQHPPHQHQPFTPLCSSPKQSAHLSSGRPPSSEISASPHSSTFSLPPSAPPPLPQYIHTKIPSNGAPTATMLPQANSDDESVAAEEEQKPNIKPCDLTNITNNTNNAAHQLDSHASSVSLYDLPTSSSAPTTSSSSSPFPSNNNNHNNNVPQQVSYSSSSPHPNQEHHPHPQHHHLHHENQFYQRSPPALHSPLQSAHHHQQQHQHQHQHQQQAFDQQRPHSSFFAHHQPYPQCPQSAPPSTSRIPLDPHVMAAAAANVEVKKWDEENTFYYQVAYKGVTVGRLKGSGLVNGTKLLNLAGISRGKRDGILKNEKIRKVVKHGTMHLKGVWIAFDRAVFLAEQHGIADKIFPLLVNNLEHYMPPEQPIMAGGSKLGPGPLFHHQHLRHPRLLPHPIKFPHPALSLGPASANSFTSTGGWPSGPSSALPSIGFNEPFSAPPIPRSSATGENSPSIYEQAQFQYLNSAHPTNPDLLERRHTIPNNTFHGYNSVPPFGSSQHTGTLAYPFAYNAGQLGGYPSRSPASESTPPSQFEYPSKTAHTGNSTSDSTASSYTASLYHSQNAPRTSSSTTAQPSPALHSAPLVLSNLSPGPSCQILDHGPTDFRLSTAP